MDSMDQCLGEEILLRLLKYHGVGILLLGAGYSLSRYALGLLAIC